MSTQPVTPRKDTTFTLHAIDLDARTVTGFRLAFGIAGAVALILGIVLLVWPIKTVAVLAAILGIYFIVAGGTRVLAGIFGFASPAGHRVLNLVLGLLVFAAGLISLKNLASSAAALLVLAVVVIGVGWIIDGILSIIESRTAQSQLWAVLFGSISILAGLSVVSVPAWSVVWLITFTSIALIVLGIVGVIRGITFGRPATAKS